MGTWSTALYGGDFACDVRDEYKNFLIEDNSPEEALRLTAEVMKPGEDEEEGYLFWLVLADAQWGYGHLMPEVKNKAMHIIKSGEDLAHWNSEGEKKSRGKVLDKLLNKLSSPQSAPRKPHKPKGYRCPWQIGDLLTARVFFQTKEPILEKYPEAIKYADKFILLHLVGIQEKRTSCDRHCAIDRLPVFFAYDWVGNAPPTIEDAKSSKIIRTHLHSKMHREVRPRDYFIGAWRYSKIVEPLDVHKIGEIDIPKEILEDYNTYKSFNSLIWWIVPYTVAEAMIRQEFGEQESALSDARNKDFISPEDSRPIQDKENIKPTDPEKINPHITKKEKGLER